MYILKTTCGISAFIATCLLSACIDEPVADNFLTNDEIAFRATVNDNMSDHAARSGVAGGFEYLEPQAVTSDFNKTLYVHTLVNENLLEAPRSRAAELHKSDLTVFNVSAYAYSGSWITPGATKQPNLIRNASVKPVSGMSLWTTDNKYFWPATMDRVRFYAFANLPDGLSPSSNYTTLSYTVNPDVTEQNDIIAAVSDIPTATYISSKDAVLMYFHHILTGIKFRTAKGDSGLGDYKIKRVSFENVYGNGKFTLKEFTGDATADREAMWSLGSGTSTSKPTSFSIDFGDGVQVESDMALTSEEQTMMMIPQILPDGAQVVVTLVDKFGTEHQLIKTLTGTDWGMGDMITYVISSNAVLVEDVFELYSVKRANATAAPGEETRLPDIYHYQAPHYNYKMYDTLTQVSMLSHYRIRSYRKEYPKYVNGRPEGEIKTTPLNFTSEGGDDWIGLFVNTSKDNKPSDDGGYYDIKVESFEFEKRDPWSRVLRERMDPSAVMPAYALDDGYYDLSKRYARADDPTKAEVNTSNCYIVSAPGNYKFPVVYGNSIRHSKINYEAFGAFLKEGASGKFPDDYLTLTDNPFVTARNKKLTEWVKENGNSPRVDNATTPKLIWSDCPDIVEAMHNSLTSYPNSADSKDEKELVLDDVTLKVKYVYFTIPDNIKQCNMMMGYVSGTSGTDVNWSWHIWVTPFVPNNYNNINTETNKSLAPEDQMLSVTSFTANGQEFKLLPYNLGWLNRVHLEFKGEERSSSFTFTQEDTGKKLTIAVKQTPINDVQYGSNLLFQWGRKDPMHGSYSFGKGEPVLKPCFRWNADKKRVEQYQISVKTDQSTVDKVLKSPQNIYGANGVHTDWNSAPSDYLWRIPPEATPAGTVKQSDGKTIYDPSPVGYLIATSNVFAEFTSNNQLVEFPINGIQSDSVYVPLCGYRDNKGILIGGGKQAYYHASDGNGMLYFNKNTNGAIGTRENLNRVISGAVRPRQDRRFTAGE